MNGLYIGDNNSIVMMLCLYLCHYPLGAYSVENLLYICATSLCLLHLLFLCILYLCELYTFMLFVCKASLLLIDCGQLALMSELTAHYCVA